MNIEMNNSSTNIIQGNQKDSPQKLNKKLFIIILIISIVITIACIVLGLVLGLRNKEKYKDKDVDDGVEIVNSYDNTDELIQKFPVINPTSVQDGLEKRIQNRLLTGFENWNRGFDAWKKWGNILYTNASIYNVHGARLTLAQYQASMDVTLKQAKILMGDFHNMLICGDFAAIYYDISTQFGTVVRPGTVMEFVRFKDYEGDLGTRVVVGWGGAKDDSFDSMRGYQGDEEKMIQDEQIHLMLNYQIPTDSDLKKKYPVLYPSEYVDKTIAEKYIEVIVNGFDKWNEDLDSYKNWLESGYTSDAISYDLKGKKRTIEEYKSEIDALFKDFKIEKLYFDNILIRDNWAAIHYRYRRENITSNEKYVGDRMQFLKFKQDGVNYKIEASWIK